jgi:hypothetical protein
MKYPSQYSPFPPGPGLLIGQWQSQRLTKHLHIGLVYLKFSHHVIKKFKLATRKVTRKITQGFLANISS